MDWTHHGVQHRLKQCALGSKAQQTTSGNEPPLGSRGLDVNCTFPSPVAAGLLPVRLRDLEHSHLLQSTVAQSWGFFVILNWIKYHLQTLISDSMLFLVFRKQKVLIFYKAAM